MPEYHVSFRKVIAEDGAQVYAQVSEEDELLVRAVEAIRSGVVASAKDAGFDLGSIPNGHFMEIEFLIERQSVRGVVFTTPYLPGPFVEILREVLAGAGIETML